MIASDFNAKVGRKKPNDGESIGEHSRGIRNVNGRALLEFCSKMKLIVANTFFQHKASHITTWESKKKNNVTIYNQTDYVITRGGRRWSLEDARSYRAMEISTDHRLVMVMCDGYFFKRRQNHANLAVVTAETTGHGSNTNIEEAAIKKERDRFSKEQKEVFAKIKQSNKETKSKKWKKKRNYIMNKIKRLNAKIEEEVVKREAREMNEMSYHTRIHQAVKNMKKSGSRPLEQC